MNATPRHTNDRTGATGSPTLVNFLCAAPRATRVELEGDFTDWQPVPMTEAVDGWWTAQMELFHGPHEYMFLLDGVPMLDRDNPGMARNEPEERIWLIEVD